MGLPEITAPTDLCLPSGAINPRAVGWSRRPLHRANLRTGSPVGRAATWSRTRRWEYWCLMTPEHVVSLSVSALNYAAVHQVWVLVRSTGAEVDHSIIIPLARDVRMPSTCGGGPVRGQGGDLAIAMDPGPEGTRLRAVAPRVRLDATAARPPGHESLGVVVPWTDRLFQYTVKDVALPVAGRLWLDGHEHVFGEDGPAWAASDFGRGRWPYAITRTWGAGAGHVDGSVTGLQLGGRWTDGTGSTENALLVDGQVQYIGEDLCWECDTSSPTAPWTVTGQRVDVRFDPVHQRVSAVNLGSLRNRAQQYFGLWHGWVADEWGTRRSVDGLEGWTEEVSSRW